VLLLWAKGLNTKDIHKELFPVYGGKFLLYKAVYNWVKKFSQEHWKLTDDARPGSPVEIAKEAIVEQVEELIRADRRIRIDSVATALGCSHGLAQKVCMWWMPRELKDWEKMSPVGLSLQHLLWYADEGEDILNRIVTGDE
jgi:transposase